MLGRSDAPGRIEPLQHELGDNQSIAGCLRGLAVEIKPLDNAARLREAAQALLDMIGAPLAPASHAESKHDEDLARPKLAKRHSTLPSPTATR